jgi:predicted nucleic acid-binding protein
VAVLFLDTNVILRHITQDHPDHGQRAYSLLQQVETGALEVTTCEAVVVEAVYVLSSRSLYNVPRQKIRDDLTAIIRAKGLKLPHKRTYLRALDLYASANLDFADALIVAHMERARITTIVSFDQHFDRVVGITRQEP